MNSLFEQVLHCLGPPLHWGPGANCPCCPHPCWWHWRLCCMNQNIKTWCMATELWYQFMVRALYVQLKINFLEKEFLLISSSFDLPGNEKSTSHGIFPFSFPWHKEKLNSEIHVSLAFFLNKTKKI